MSFNSETDISEQTIRIINDTVDNSIISFRSFILFAQMQSGKTNAFLLFAGEMLRQEKIENVIIFTGNRDNELKNQLIDEIRGSNKKQSFFDLKYTKYLMDYLNLFSELTGWERHQRIINLVNNIKHKIMVVWGTEIKKKANKIPKENSLFIFEESHFAQSLNQMPDIFFGTIGLPPNGDKRILEEKGNYIFSISATPFSELYDNDNFNQMKKVIYLQPGDNYRGVKWFKENNKIIGYKNWRLSFENALQTRIEDNNWAIIRVHGNENAELAEEISIRNGWQVKKYDQESFEIENMLKLKNKPDFPTIIIIKERCRMGTVVPKDYLSFLFETSNKMNTDTLLQGLLGRACGYHNNDNLIIYINKKIIDDREIEKYICLFDNLSQENQEFSLEKNERKPVLAKNVEKTKDRDRKNKKYAIPIRIPKNLKMSERGFNKYYNELECNETDYEFNLDWFDNLSNINKKNVIILYSIIKAIDEKLVTNLNDSFDINITDKIIKILKDEIENIKIGKPKINYHSLKNTNKTMKDIPRIIYSSIEKEEPPLNLCSGNGKGIGGTSLYYVGEENYEENGNKVYKYEEIQLEYNSYYLCAHVEEVLFENNISPQTTGNEIFRYDNLDDINSGYNLIINKDAVRDKNIMHEVLRECIFRSQETESILKSPKCITSIPQPYFEKTNCIYLSEDVYNSLIYGGEINNKIYKEFKIHLEIPKCKGRPPSNMPSDCSKRISKISWE